MNDEDLAGAPADPKTSPWVLIPLGMLLILVGGITFCVFLAISALLEAAAAIFFVLLVMVYLLIRFPGAAIAHSRHP